MGSSSVSRDTELPCEVLSHNAKFIDILLMQRDTVDDNGPNRGADNDRGWVLGGDGDNGAGTEMMEVSPRRSHS
ncbi:Os02g0640150 [Oryza sativa Japonica Group]|uniref:Os02g0640150 protein n=1 Tax=Oryza sativa subsp. japonica TaxID=39947 RepID=A0A0N7KFR8_ORYSJ|nr:Os02g0640150 [Oryza sativa Japonica Group]